MCMQKRPPKSTITVIIVDVVLVLVVDDDVGLIALGD